jgi:hypothetical protein
VYVTEEGPANGCGDRLSLCDRATSVRLTKSSEEELDPVLLKAKCSRISKDGSRGFRGSLQGLRIAPRLPMLVAG